MLIAGILTFEYMYNMCSEHAEYVRIDVTGLRSHNGAKMLFYTTCTGSVEILSVDKSRGKHLAIIFMESCSVNLYG